MNTSNLHICFLFVNPETISEEEYFPVTEKIVENYKKMSTAGPVTKY